MNDVGLAEALRLGLSWQGEGAGAAIVHLLPSRDESTPSTPKKLVVRSDGHRTGAFESSFDAAAVQAASEALASGKSRQYSLTSNQEGGRVVGMDSGDVDIFVEVLAPAPSLVIVGAGHVAQPLAVIGDLLGWSVTVIDDRPDFANRERFPTAGSVLAEEFVSGLEKVEITKSSFIVLVTRGHVHDAACLRLVLDTPAAYIGMIGSKVRIRTVLEKLEQEGFSREALNRVYGPIGIDIGSHTPPEIALAIAAEIVNLKRGGTAPHLQLRKPL